MDIHQDILTLKVETTWILHFQAKMWDCHSNVVFVSLRLQPFLYMLFMSIIFMELHAWVLHHNIYIYMYIAQVQIQNVPFTHLSESWTRKLFLGLITFPFIIKNHQHIPLNSDLSIIIIINVCLLVHVYFEVLGLKVEWFITCILLGICCSFNYH